MTIIQYFNEHILTFLYKRYKFARRSFLLFPCECNTIRGPQTLFTALLVSYLGAKL